MSWQYVQVADVAEVFNGKTPSRAEQRDNGSPVLKIKDVNDNGIFKGEFDSFVEKSLADKFSQKSIQLDDTLVLNAAHNSDYVGNKQYRAQPQVVGAMPTGEWLIIRANSKVLEPRFLNFWISSAETRFRIKRLVKGIHLYPKDVARLTIPLPPLKEQKRIAAILDKADAIRRKRQQAIQLADDFLRAVFLDMFGDPVTNPKGWEVKPLVSLCNKITDGTHHSPPIVENGVQYITAKHLKTTGLEFHSNPWFVSKEEHQKIFSRCNPEPKDVLYIKDGATTGLAAINEYDFEFSMLSSLALLKPNYDLITSEFLCSFLNHPKTKLVLTANMAGAAITRLTLAKIKDVRVPLPNIESQMKFSEIYNSVRELVGKIKRSDNLALDEFNSLSQKAFAGEL